MGSVNKVLLIGHLGADPEVRQAGSSQVANLRLATSEQWTDREGNRQEKTEWHRVVAWGRVAEACGKYLHKGSLVYVEGSLETRKWTDRDGNDRYTTEVKARQVVFLDSRGVGSRQGQGSGAGGGSYGRRTDSAPPGPVNDDDDLPF